MICPQCGSKRAKVERTDSYNSKVKGIYRRIYCPVCGEFPSWQTFNRVDEFTKVLRE